MLGLASNHRFSAFGVDLSIDVPGSIIMVWATHARDMQHFNTKIKLYFSRVAPLCRCRSSAILCA